MSTQQLEILAPLALPLPDPPKDEVLTADQWMMLLSIMDTVIPSIRRESVADDVMSNMKIPDGEYSAVVEEIKKTAVKGPDAPDDTIFEKYLDEKPSDSANFQNLLRLSLANFAREDARKGLAFILSTLNTRMGSLIFTGSTTPFHQQPIHVRTSILDGWRQSYLPLLPTCYKSFTSMGKSIWTKTTLTLPQISGFPKVPQHYKPAPAYEYDFLQFVSGESPEVIDTDVLIIGSGCGGAVCAKNLSEAGHRVLLVDKSYYFPPKYLPMSEMDAGINLFENGGVEMSDDQSISVIAGSTWGGGGTINWSASLQTQGFVRKEWAQDKGLKFFQTEEFQNCLDRVCDRMGVSTEYIRHNHGNRVLLEGARKLGYHAKAVPQNTGGNEHFCGHCTLGCGAAQKQGPVVSWLPDAAHAGARFAEGFKVEKITFQMIGGEKTAVGAEGTWTSRNSSGGVNGPITGRTVRKIVIKAKKVIVSCGTLWTPIILLNSGLTNRHIGRNLHLHPVNIVLGVFKEEVKPWEGGILTTVCSTFEDLDTHGHGCKLEATAMLPSWILPLLNWESGLDFKLQASKFRHMNGYISLARDRDTGRVYKDAASGLPRIQYTPSKFDRANIMEGVIALARILYVTNAEEIHFGYSGSKPFIRNPDAATASAPSKEETDERFEEWLTQIKAVGNAPPAGLCASAHQMGTNRMSALPNDGVVDPHGAVWGVNGLYVSDASVFPSATGVNPMITNMAISDYISRGIAKELNTEKGRRGVSAGL